ncbi:MAG: TMEM175 family protein [Actinomycetota bacterium]|nr:TMEM175 family protein [Actinomycetota bacterium]
MSTERRPIPMGRVEAFSDGVYAIVITLLVLELAVPEDSRRLVEDLLEGWPAFLGYLISFVFIGASWISHTKLTPSLSACDDLFVGLNLLKLLFVSFLPFTSSLLATHLGDDAQGVAAVVFGANLTLATAMSAVLYGFAARNEQLLRDGERPHLQARTRELWHSAALLLAATAVAAFFPGVAVGFYLAISALMLVRPLVRWSGLGRRTRRERNVR